MSRAFVKEPDGDAVGDDAPELPISSHPNYMTPVGLNMLEDELTELKVQRQVLIDLNDPVRTQIEVFAIEREQRYLKARIDSALVQEPDNHVHGKVGFGASVKVVDEDDTENIFTIVGEDQADPNAGLISWTSPLARILTDKEVGDTVTWRRPKGDMALEILQIRYEESAEPS
ncbi:MAG: transcription elongation factor GreAB [Rhodospirillales bacterium]|jgi:transcription elongation factor GreB|nr:transcription elongation factor GreAB [Rhodospirillales bacterium]